MTSFEQNFERILYTKTFSLLSKVNQIKQDELSNGQKVQANIALEKMFVGIFGIPENSTKQASNLKNKVEAICESMLNNVGTVLDGYQRYMTEPIQARKRLNYENIKKPQLLFTDYIDNSLSRPFIPKILHKYNAKRQLDSNLLHQINNSKELNADHIFDHPYSFEINDSKLPKDVLTIASQFAQDSNVVHSFNRNPLVEIDTVEKLEKTILELQKHKIISFEAHNHSFRSFLGFVCFLEISTADKDFLIDTLVLRDHIYKLNQIFTDSCILKLAFQANHKLLWLQRDFGLYCVGAIDISILLRQLNIPGSIPFISSSLLEFSVSSVQCEFDIRKRPLSYKEKTYLKTFSWVTLAAFCKLSESYSRAVMNNYLEVAFFETREFEKAVYSKNIFIEDTASVIVSELKDKQDGKKLISKLNKLLEWRDERARFEDESHDYILPGQLLKTILKNTSDIESLRHLYQQHPADVANDHIETVFTIMKHSSKSWDDKDGKQEKSDFLNSLFTPHRGLQDRSNLNTDKESPAYDQADLHHLIHWSSGGKSNLHNDLMSTPVRKYNNILQRTYLTPSIFKDSPSEDTVEVPQVLLNILNSRNDFDGTANTEINSFILSSCKKTDQNNLSEIKEDDDNFIEVIEFINTNEDIPDSIADIYSMGNNIRKRNKTKKQKDVKLKGQENFTPNPKAWNPQFSSNSKENIEGKLLFVEKNSSTTKNNQPEQFLRELGWLE